MIQIVWISNVADYKNLPHLYTTLSTSTKGQYLKVMQNVVEMDILWFQYTSNNTIHPFVNKIMVGVWCIINNMELSKDIYAHRRHHVTPSNKAKNLLNLKKNKILLVYSVNEYFCKMYTRNRGKHCQQLLWNFAVQPVNKITLCVGLIQTPMKPFGRQYPQIC